MVDFACYHWPSCYITYMSDGRITAQRISIGHDNARYEIRFPCYITYMNDATQTSNLPASRRNIAHVLPVASLVLRGQTNMTIIFIATDSTDNTPIAFSNIGTALDYVRDAHGDLNPVDAALMLDGRTGLVPATNKAVKAARGTLRFVATGADAASTVAGIQSKLDGALSACSLVGIDPANVAKVTDLRAKLEIAQANVGAEDDSVTFKIVPITLHKRAHKKRA